jgi:ribonuclease BN (tRNA processing enzyme)
VAEGLRRAGIPVSQPHVVLLTSLLPENVQGLDDLLLTGWIGGREGRLRVIGPAGTRALVAGLEAALAGSAQRWRDDVTPDAALPLFAVEEAADGWSAELGALRLRATAQAASLAWRIEAGARAALVSGARPGEEAVLAAARGADLLVLPAVYGASVDAAVAAGTPEGERIGREAALAWRIEAAGELAERAGVRRLLLVRLRPLPLFDLQYERIAGARYEGDVEIADDGEEFVIR